MKLSPSIASANQINLQSEIEKLGDWPYLHIDIEDGNFMPNITFGLKTIEKIAQHSKNFTLDAHLIVTNPLYYVKPLSDMGIKILCSHIEPILYPLEFINLCKKSGIEKIGFALNFITPIEMLEPFYKDIDFVMIMTAEPDNNQLNFYPPIINKIKKARAILPDNIEIYIDGCLDEEKLVEFKKIGVDLAILGRTVFNSVDYNKTLNNISQRLDKIKKY